MKSSASEPGLSHNAGVTLVYTIQIRVFKRAFTSCTRHRWNNTKQIFPWRKNKKVFLFYVICVEENLSSLPWKDFLKLFLWVCSGCCNSTFFKQPLGQHNNLSFNIITVNKNKNHLYSHFLVIQEERNCRKLYQTNLTWLNPFFLTFRKDVALEENQLDRRTCWLFGQWGDTRQYFVLCSESFRLIDRHKI